jgi:hypothetical protein
MTASAPVAAAVVDCRLRHLVDLHFRGKISPRKERNLRAHLVDCADCRSHYDRHLLLAAVDPEATLSRPLRLGRGLGLAPSAPTRRGGWLALAGATAVTAVVLLVAGVRPPLGFQARGAGAKPESQLLVYELPTGSSARPLGDELRRDSGLAFAYVNVGHRQRLMVFAVDEDRRVYWYHPSWLTPSDDPPAVAIAQDESLHEIPQATTHRFVGPRLRLFGLFLDMPLSARAVESLVARAPVDERGAVRLDVPGADVARRDLRLVPGP